MDNWKELVGYQPIKEEIPKVFYMVRDTSAENNLGLKILNQVIECNLTEPQLIEKLNEIYGSFTTKINLEGVEENKKIHHIIRAKSQVAVKTRRGVAQTEWKNSIFYKGSNSWDCPVIVTELNGKYGIFVHPDFDKYGFIVEG